MKLHFVFFSIDNDETSFRANIRPSVMGDSTNRPDDAFGADIVIVVMTSKHTLEAKIVEERRMQTVSGNAIKHPVNRRMNNQVTTSAANVEHLDFSFELFQVFEPRHDSNRGIAL